MTSKTNLGLVEWVYTMLGQPYWYGTCCYPATQALLKRKSEQYPQYYTADRMKRYKEDMGRVEPLEGTDGRRGTLNRVTGPPRAV